LKRQIIIFSKSWNIQEDSLIADITEEIDEEDIEDMIVVIMTILMNHIFTITTIT